MLVLNSHVIDTRTLPVHQVHHPYIGCIASSWYITHIFCILQLKQQHKYKTVRIIIAFFFVYLWILKALFGILVMIRLG